jgi:hypothetical protein
MIWINLAIMAICGVLWRIGGSGPKPARRIGIPVILALYFAITEQWWLFFIEGAAYGLTIPIGYGAPTPDDDKPSFLGKIFRKGWIIRAMYGLIVSGTGALPLVIAGDLGLWAYLGYLALNFTIGALVVVFKLKDVFAEILVGLGFASVVLGRKKPCSKKDV